MQNINSLNLIFSKIKNIFFHLVVMITETAYLFFVDPYLFLSAIMNRLIKLKIK